MGQYYIDLDMLLRMLSLGVNQKFFGCMVGELDSNNLIQSSIVSMSKASGVDPNTGRRTMKLLREAGYVLRYSSDFYQLSPYLLFRTNGKSRDIIIEMYEKRRVNENNYNIRQDT